MLEHKDGRQIGQNDFSEARRRANRSQIRAWFSGKENQLIPFEALRSELRDQNPYYVGVAQIPLAQIVGSLGRYQDFTREFLPLNESMRERWIRVERLAFAGGWPPVELYQVGDGYFVRDGNHRIAIAKQMGNDTIEAAVWRYPQTVALATAESLNEALLRLGEQRFFKQTQLDRLYPDHEIRFTVAGRFQYLLTQIEQMHRNLAQIDREEVESIADIPYEEAVRFWYECLFDPALERIHQTGIMDNFPERTAADLYVWFWRYREKLQERFGTSLIGESLEQAVEEGQPSAVGRAVNQVLNIFGLGKPEPLDVDAAEENFS